MRRVAVLLAAVAVSLSAAAPASGHSVMKVENGAVFYNATDDVALNRLSITVTGDRLRFYDPGADNGITPPSECTPGELDPSGNPREVFCPSGGISLVRVDVGEGQDDVAASLPISVLVVGGNGADKIVTGVGNDTVNGDEGNDDVRTGEGEDTVVGGGGDDSLVSGTGNDVAQGGLGADVLDTGAGDDEVRLRDGVSDRVACGDGGDRAQTEDLDQLADCETVDSIATPGGAAGGPGAGGSTARPGGTAGEIAGSRADSTAPRLRAGGSTRQRLGRRRAVLVVASVDEAAELYATGYVETGGRRYALSRARSRVTVAGGGTELRVTMNERALTAVRRALRRKRRVTAVVSVLATDAAGNSTPKRLPMIRLS